MRVAMLLGMLLANWMVGFYQIDGTWLDGSSTPATSTATTTAGSDTGVSAMDGDMVPPPHP